MAQQTTKEILKLVEYTSKIASPAFLESLIIDVINSSSIWKSDIKSGSLLFPNI